MTMTIYRRSSNYFFFFKKTRSWAPDVSGIHYTLRQGCHWEQCSILQCGRKIRKAKIKTLMKVYIYWHNTVHTYKKIPKSATECFVGNNYDTVKDTISKWVLSPYSWIKLLSFSMTSFSLKNGMHTLLYHSHMKYFQFH